MLSRQLKRITFAFANKYTTGITSQVKSFQEQEEESKLGVHLLPYDAKKYQKPSHEIKINSGYAFLDIEPFPRARIMRICYNIMYMLRKRVPDTCLLRLLLEEQMKYIMKIVDEEESVIKLEKILAVESIEIFLMNLMELPAMIELYIQNKLWEKEQGESYDPDYMTGFKIPPDTRKPTYQRQARTAEKIVNQ